MASAGCFKDAGIGTPAIVSLCGDIVRGRTDYPDVVPGSTRRGGLHYVLRCEVKLCLPVPGVSLQAVHGRAEYI